MILTENTLIKLSVIVVILGLILLYQIALRAEPTHVNITGLTLEYSGKFVNLTGTISGIKKSGSGWFLDLKEGNSTVKVVLWNDVLEEMRIKGVDLDRIKKGINVSVAGLVQIYRGRPNVVPIKSQLSFIE